LFRTSILGKTSLIDAYPASDMILLGEVALHGTFHEIPEPLFLRRDHSDSSVKANLHMRNVLPGSTFRNGGKIQLPTWRWVLRVDQVDRAGADQPCQSGSYARGTYSGVGMGKQGDIGAN
jgi:hypothetical protein